MKTKNKQGLYFNGEFKAENYSDAIRELYQINEIPRGFCLNDTYEAIGYSVVDSNGIQHNYEVSSKDFYNAFMQLN